MEEEFSSRTKLGDHLDVPRKMIDKWAREGMPGVHGKYVASEVRAWLANRDGDPDTKKLVASVELIKERIRKERRMNDVADGRLVSRDDVEGFFTDFFSRIRDQFMAVPEMMKPSWPVDRRNQFAEELEGEIRVILEGLASYEYRIEDVIDAAE